MCISGGEAHWEPSGMKATTGRKLSLVLFYSPASFFFYIKKFLNRKTILIPPSDFSLFQSALHETPMSKPTSWREKRITVMSSDKLPFILALGLGRTHILETHGE